TRSKGVTVVPYDKDGRKSTYLDGYSVTSVMVDNQGGYWFTTLEQGVFYAQNSSTEILNENYGLLDEYITEITGSQSDVVIGSKSGSIQIINQVDKINTIYTGNDDLECRSILYDSIQHVFHSVYSKYHSFDSNGVQGSYLMFSAVPYEVVMLEDEKIIGCGTHLINIPKVYKNMSQDNESPIYWEGNILSNLGICRCMAAKSIEKVYLGRNDGLYVLNLTDTGFVLTSLATVHPGFSDR